MTMTKDEIINRIVDRFLQWKLPEDFRPDCGIEFDRDKYVRLNPLNRPFKPFGTNLLTATQATAMVKAIVGPEIEALINEARGEPQAGLRVSGELPDDMRVPLHSLQADLSWIIGRIATEDEEARAMLKDSIRVRLGHIEEAAYRMLHPAPAAADELLAALKLLSKDATTTRAVWVKVKAAIAKAEGCET